MLNFSLTVVFFELQGTTSETGKALMLNRIGRKHDKKDCMHAIRCHGMYMMKSIYDTAVTCYVRLHPMPPL